MARRTPARIWDLLTSPSAQIADPVDQRRARFLTGILFVGAPATTLISIAVNLERFGELSARQWTVFMAAQFLVWGSYFASRTRYTVAVAYTFVLTLVLIPSVGAIQEPSPSVALGTLAFHAGAVLVASLLLGQRPTIALTIGSVVSSLIVVTVHPTLELIDASLAIGLTVFAGILAVATAEYHRLAERDRRETEAQLALSDRLASIGTLAAGVAHEINNPLAFVQLSLHTIEDDLSAVIAGYPDVAEALADAIDGTERISSIVKDLSTFAGPERSGASALDPHEVIERALRIAGARLRDVNAKVDFEPSPEPLQVRIAERQLGQIVLNLVLNAADAIDAGGHIAIRVARAQDDDEMAMLEVRDDGHGIPEDEIPHLFDPFFSTKSVGKGMGLGLSVSRTMVVSAGGTIDVESAVDEGTTFRIRLPSPLR